MPYRYEIQRCPIVRDKCDSRLLTYERQSSVTVLKGVMPNMSDESLHLVSNQVEHAADVLHASTDLETTWHNGWSYYVRWIDKPRQRRFRFISRNVFGSAGKESNPCF